MIESNMWGGEGAAECTSDQNWRSVEFSEDVGLEKVARIRKGVTIRERDENIKFNLLGEKNNIC